jgi:hypothetical protein
MAGVVRPFWRWGGCLQYTSLDRGLSVATLYLGLPLTNEDATQINLYCLLL